MKAFRSPTRWLDKIDADATALLIMAAADVAIVLDNRGVVRDVAFQSEALALEFAGQDHWVEQPWRDTVTVESRPKIDEMLRDAQSRPPRNGRQVNYPAADGGGDIPILFSIFPVGKTKRLMAIGRDLRAFAALQQRVVDVQQSFERDYARMRHIETRYRILFQMMPEPVLIVDAASQKIVEANPAAAQLFGPKAKVVGQAVGQLTEEASRPAVETLLAAVRAEGKAGDVKLRFTGTQEDLSASALAFQQDGARLALIRLANGAGPTGALGEGKETMLKLVERGPDGFVATDQNGLVIAANQAFLEMAQLPNEAQARGAALDRWLGRPGVDLNVLLNSLRQQETVRLFSTVLRDEFGAESEVEVSAAAIRAGGGPSFGFAIRSVARRAASPAATAPRTYPKSIEQITQLIGRVSLKELAREATDVIELLCIEAALTMTGDNKASAAEILGLSRQSLYVKMRRHGLIEGPIVDAE